jgi:hypothetical protein
MIPLPPLKNHPLHKPAKTPIDRVTFTSSEMIIGSEKLHGKKNSRFS